MDGDLPGAPRITTVAVAAARCGPPGTANGGWACGVTAGPLGAGAVEVTLRAPTPLETPLDLRVDGDAAYLSLGDQVLASAKRSPGALRVPGPVGWDEAVAAAPRFHGHRWHPFPECYVCGTERAVGDGMRIFPGPLLGGPSGVSERAAAVFTPPPDLAGADGRLPVPAVWAALDCPTAWVNMGAGDAALLGRLRAEVHGDVVAGQAYLVVAETDGVEGRKAFGRAALYDRDGQLLAASEAVWIRPRPDTAQG